MNLKLDKQLLLAFGLIMAIALFPGVIGVYSLARIGDSLETMQHSFLPDVLSLQRINEAAADIKVAELSMSETMPSPSLWFHYRRLDEAWRRAELGIRAFTPSQEEQPIWSNFLALWQKWRARHTEVRKLFEAGQFKEAHQLSETYEPTPFDRPLNQLIRLHLQQTEQRIVRTHTRQVDHLYFLGFAIAISLIISVLLSMQIARSITQPLCSCVEMARMIGKGDLTAQLEIEREDEIGELITELNQMSAFLRAMFAEITESAGQLASVASGLAGLSEHRGEGETAPSRSRFLFGTILDEMQSQLEVLHGLTSGLSARMEELRRGLTQAEGSQEAELGKLETTVQDNAFVLELMSRRLKLMTERFKV